MEEAYLKRKGFSVGVYGNTSSNPESTHLPEVQRDFFDHTC